VVQSLFSLTLFHFTAGDELRALVLGAGGQLGAEIVDELHRRNHVATALGRRQLDITNPAAVDASFQEHQPQWVVNCAAYNKVDLAEKEPETAMKINGLAVRTLAVACQDTGATFLHFSTDHVFDGAKRAPYTEEDAPNPPSSYAVSKLAGELYARALCESLYVVRVAGVFGPAGRFTRHSNFPELILRKAQEGAPLRVVDDFFATPTYAPALASRSLDLLERAAQGLYHIGGGTSISWYHYALKILEVAGLEADIQPTNKENYPTPARRPRQAALSNAKVEKLGLAPMPSLDDALRDYMKQREQVKPPKGD
jgi:dTDP-4-dehydrorhamnose reductase